jgi:uncharacterized ferritin-like protein (DUF455 family)
VNRPETYRDFALAIIGAGSLAAKLRPPELELRDRPADRGASLRPMMPARDAATAILAGRAAKVPPVSGWPDPHQRARILHAYINHELQAAELFLWALLAFPETEDEFRRGLLRIALEEQRHARLYLDLLAGLGHRFGDFPVNGHFWSAARQIDSPLAFVARMGITFEGANLDFSHDPQPYLGEDDEARAVLAEVHADEIGHVAFAWRWFERWRDPRVEAWTTYCKLVGGEARAGRARGRAFDRAAREAAGMSEGFLARLESAAPSAPGGRRR